jgi:hypothetical protein
MSKGQGDDRFGQLGSNRLRRVWQGAEAGRPGRKAQSAMQSHWHAPQMPGTVTVAQMRSGKQNGPHAKTASHAVPQVLPNPSLERTRTGKAPWPRRSQVYHPPRGQAASPVRAAQLKR